MDEQERDYLRQQVRELQRSKRRWKLATFTLAAALGVLLIGGGISSLLFGLVGLQQQREAMMMEYEQVRAAEAARLQAEQAAQQHEEIVRPAMKLEEKTRQENQTKRDRAEGVPNDPKAVKEEVGPRN